VKFKVQCINVLPTGVMFWDSVTHSLQYHLLINTIYVNRR